MLSISCKSYSASSKSQVESRFWPNEVIPLLCQAMVNLPEQFHLMWDANALWAAHSSGGLLKYNFAWPKAPWKNEQYLVVYWWLRSCCLVFLSSLLISRVVRFWHDSGDFWGCVRTCYHHRALLWQNSLQVKTHQDIKATSVKCTYSISCLNV